MRWIKKKCIIWPFDNISVKKLASIYLKREKERKGGRRERGGGERERKGERGKEREGERLHDGKTGSAYP